MPSFIRHTRFICLLIVLVGCKINVVNRNDISNYLDSLIGRKYDGAIGWNNWNIVYEDNLIIKLEARKASGCTYEIKVDKRLMTVQSWEITSPLHKCDNNYSPSV